MARILNSRAAGLALLGLLAVAAVAFIVWPRPARREIARSKEPETLARDLVQRDGHWFLKANTNAAFTGVMVEKYPNGSLLARVEISSGSVDGWSETWHTNGQANVREHFKNGVSDGLRERWYENGKKQSEAHVVEGKVDGLFERWHENGQLAEKIQMKEGQPVGVAWAYYPSGFVKAETTLEGGKPINQKSWKDGQFTNVQ